MSAPVIKKPSEEDEIKEGTLPRVEYGNYLKQVIDVLETDPEFKKKIESLGNDSDIMSVVNHFDLVSHHVRTKLDEIKRIELNRLNKMEARLEKLQKSSNFSLSRIDKDHINIHNDLKFEEEDLRRLISKTVEIANKLDAKAEEEYRRYQMEKEIKRKLRLSKIKSKEMRDKQRLLDAASEKRHKSHPAIHYPGTEEQLKEVWEKEDKLDPNSFNPVTFFRLHDTNEDGHLDIAEIEAIMQIEIQDELNQTIYSPEEFEKFKKEYKTFHPDLNMEAVDNLDKESSSQL